MDYFVGKFLKVFKINIMYSTSMLCYVYSSGTITAEHFMHFLNTRVRPMLLEDSYGIFDNARIHTTMNSRRIVVEKVFAEQYYFCPPYSPHLKPIEPCFALEKQWIREYINRAFHIHSVGETRSGSIIGYWLGYFSNQQLFLNMLLN